MLFEDEESMEYNNLDHSSVCIAVPLKACISLKDLWVPSQLLSNRNKTIDSNKALNLHVLFIVGNSLLYYILYISIGFIYPAYCSLLALQSKNKNDDTDWLIYWIVFAIFHAVEFVSDYVLFWFPLYSVFKLGFLTWCTAPIGKNGAFYVYKLFLEPFYRLYGGHINYIVNQGAEIIQSTWKYVPDIHT